MFLPKGIIDNYNVINNGKNVIDQANDSDIKRYQEIRKLATRQDEDYTTRCLLDYDYIKKLLQIDIHLFKQKKRIRYRSKNN